MKHKYVAWDTSTKIGALSALELDQSTQVATVVKEWTLSVEVVHSEKLLWAVDELLSQCHWKLNDLKGLLMGRGPGSFTGLRIGLTTGRTLSQVTGLELYSFSSLSAMALPELKSLDDEKYLCIAVDACKGEIFTLFGKVSDLKSYISPENGLYNQNVIESVLPPFKLVELLKEKGANQIAFFGNALKRYKKDLGPLIESGFLKSDDTLSINAMGVSQAAKLLLEKGKPFPSFKEAHPVYLRASNAEIRLNQGLLKSSPVE